MCVCVEGLSMDSAKPKSLTNFVDLFILYISKDDFTVKVMKQIENLWRNFYQQIFRTHKYGGDNSYTSEVFSPCAVHRIHSHGK